MRRFTPMKHRKYGLIFSIIILISIDGITHSVQAIPAFARRYRISCSTCHAPFPKLKEYGEEFAGNGMILVEEEQERDYVTAGDDMLWLNREFPVGVRFDAYTVYDEDTDVDKDLQIPWGLKLLSGGTLYKNIGYYFYFYMSERGEVAGIEDAYIHFNNLFGSELDIMVGQFQTSDPLMKRELRLTFEDYLIYKTKIGLSRTNLTYDRGMMLVYGIEKTGTEMVGMMVNGNGKREADDNNKFDDDNNKNFGIRINQSVGGLFSVGGFYYIGKENTLGGTEQNKLTYWGPDLNTSIGPFEITAQYLVRKDTNPLFDETVEDCETKGTVVELVISPQGDRSRAFLTCLYNQIESDLDGYLLPNIEQLKYKTLTYSGTILIARNLKFIVEYTRDLERTRNRLVFGLVGGF